MNERVTLQREHLLRFRLRDGLLQSTIKQAQGLQMLSNFVARGIQKARLGIPFYLLNFYMSVCIRFTLTQTRRFSVRGCCVSLQRSGGNPFCECAHKMYCRHLIDN